MNQEWEEFKSQQIDCQTGLHFFRFTKIVSILALLLSLITCSQSYLFTNSVESE